MSSTFTHKWLSDFKRITSAKKVFLMLKYWILQRSLALREQAEHVEICGTRWKHFFYWCCFGELLATDYTKSDVHGNSSITSYHPLLPLPADLEYEHTGSTLLHRGGWRHVGHTHFIIV